ncbi:MAG: GTPase RsgA, partial [Clostridia bacterium]|nr:GTPase RsgA [Clostridia bacterium]
MTETEMKQGTLIRGFGGFYVVVDGEGCEYTLRCKKKFRRMKLSPLVGDEVMFTPGSGEEHGWLEEILPRTSECLRPPVANVALLLIVVALVPEPDLLLVDRMMVRARAQQMDMLLVINKCDLDESLADELRAQYAGANVQVCPVSAKSGQGLGELKALMGSRLCCLTGQSGVGKSTLLNALFGLELETGEISR